MQFYPSDWLTDLAVRSVSPAARGLWFDLLCIMWTSPHRGELRMPNGCPMDAQTMARVTGVHEHELGMHLAELEKAAVFSRCDDGAIYNRRMSREWACQRAKSEHGRKGADARWRDAQNAPSTPTSPSAPTSKDKDCASPDGSACPPTPKRSLKTPDTDAILTWFYGLWSRVNAGKPYPRSAETYPKACKAAARLLNDKPTDKPLAAWLAELEPAALSALRGEFVAAAPGGLAVYVAKRGSYVETNRKRSNPGAARQSNDPARRANAADCAKPKIRQHGPDYRCGGMPASDPTCQACEILRR